MDLEVFSSPGSEEPMDLSLPQDRIRSGQREYNLLTVGRVQDSRVKTSLRGINNYNYQQVESGLGRVFRLEMIGSLGF
jgi:hypothetical protein